MKPHFVYKPKTPQLTKTLFWEAKTPNYTLYKQFATKDPRVVGIMFADSTKIDRKNYFHILLLYVKEQGKGFGKEFIEFAKNRSKQLDCEGRVFLMADKGVYGSTTPPHIFYRKQGFTSNDKAYLKIIDRFIKENKKMENKDSKALYMYYDPNKRSLLQRIKDYFNITFFA